MSITIRTAGARRRNAQGFSLIELSVALVVSGLIALLIWRWTSTAQEPATLQAMQAELVEAQAAIEGFVLANHRLPCAAATTAGAESCASANSVLLPWRALGLASSAGRLHYGVNRGGNADLAATPPATFSPDLNLTLSGVPDLQVPEADAADATAAAALVQTQIDAAAARRTVANGLDWCAVVGQLATSVPGTAGLLLAGNVAGQIPVAYIVVHPGANGQFDGNNAVGSGGTWSFDMPGQPQTAQFDDQALAVGPADLAGRIGCVTKGAAARAAAQVAYAQYDTTRVMQQYWSLRAYDLVTAQGDVDGAITGVVMAAMDLALATTGTTVGLASAANTEGLTIYAVAIEVFNLTNAGVNVAFAAQDLIDAQAALVASQAKLVAANDYAARTYRTLAQTLGESVRLDTRGLNP